MRSSFSGCEGSLGFLMMLSGNSWIAPSVIAGWKFCTIWFYLAAISAVPALALYVGGILLSPNVDVIAATWDLPFRILAASAVLAIPTGAIALCLSSMTQESRFAGFGWFAIWILGWFTFTIMTSAEALGGGGSSIDMDRVIHRWSHVSLYHMLGSVQSWVFGFESFFDVRWSFAILAALTITCLVLLNRNVMAPMRA